MPQASSSKKDCSYLDIDFKNNGIYKVLVDAGIIKEIVGEYEDPKTMNMYALARFNLKELKRYDPFGYERFSKLYNQNNKVITKGLVLAMTKYISEENNKGRVINYSDMILSSEEYNKFQDWFADEIKPFKIVGYDDMFSVVLDEKDFCYDWENEKVTDTPYYGDGYCYEDAFCKYIEDNNKALNDGLNYDCEMSMFCVYCDSVTTASEVAYMLSELYKNEDKMLEIIKELKEKYDYEFSMEEDVYKEKNQI